MVLTTAREHTVPAGAPREPARAPVSGIHQPGRARRLGYILLPLVLVMVAAPLQTVSWRSGPALHTSLEIIASLIALIVAVISLLRYYTRKSNRYLLVSAGFLGTALLDGYHALVTGPLLGSLPAPSETLVPWSWNASRVYLGLFLILSWWAGAREERRGGRARLDARGVYILVIILTAATFVFFAVAPLPRAHYSELILGRPEDLVPGALFLVALAGYLKQGAWRRDAFEHWLVLSLFIGLASQTVVMPRSFHLYDAMFDLAHLLKIASYACVSVGLFIHMHQLFQQAESSAAELSQLNRSLSREVETRQRAEESLEILASSLAKPPPASSLAPKSFHIGRFSLTDMMSCGAAIRGLADRVDPRTASDDGLTREQQEHVAFAKLLVKYLRSSLLDDDDRPAFALVRLFETRRLDQLTGKQRAALDGAEDHLAPGTTCLTLLATAGELPGWNHVGQSRHHHVIPLPGPEAINRMPMMSQLIRQLGFEVSGILRPESDILLRRTMGVFHVPEAAGSPYIPDQEDFVRPHGIKSVVGFGDSLVDGRLFTVIMFSRVPISADLANLLSHLGHSTRMALLGFLNVPNRIEAQILSLNRLLANHETIVSDQDRRLRQTLTDLTRANEELRRSNIELDQFADIASHDLRSPLRNIDNLAQWITEDLGGALPEESRRHLEALRSRVDRMDRLLNDLLQYSRAGRSESEPARVDVAGLLEEIAELIPLPEGFQVKVTPPLPELHTPATALRRVFQNLIENAIKHHDRSEGLIEISCRDLGKLVEFTVRDDGPGIPPQFHERVFRIFQTLSRRDDVEASGMGLAMVRKTVESHGGSIRLESDGKRGSSFTFTWRKGA